MVCEVSATVSIEKLIIRGLIAVTSADHLGTVPSEEQKCPKRSEPWRDQH